MATACQELLRAEFPTLDPDLQNYVQGKEVMRVACRTVTNAMKVNGLSEFSRIILLDIIASSGDDFADSLEVFDAVGEILMEGDSSKSEEQARKNM